MSPSATEDVVQPVKLVLEAYLALLIVIGEAPLMKLAIVGIVGA